MIGVTLCIEPRAGIDPDTVVSRFTAGGVFDTRSDQIDGTVIVAGDRAEHEPAIEQLWELKSLIERAFLLLVLDGMMSGHGWVYERTTDGLVEREQVNGAQRYGIDVIDYVKREYDIDGPQ